MSKPGADPSSGISVGDALKLPTRHPACRRREAQPGSCKERENLAGDAKGKGPSGANRKAESTDAPERGGLLRSSEESAVKVDVRSAPMSRHRWLGLPLPKIAKKRQKDFGGIWVKCVRS